MAKRAQNRTARRFELLIALVDIIALSVKASRTTVGLVLLGSVLGLLAVGALRRRSTLRRAQLAGLWPTYRPLEMEDVRCLLLQQQRMLAIRAYREIRHCDLREAQSAIDRLQGEMTGQALRAAGDVRPGAGGTPES